MDKYQEAINYLLNEDKLYGTASRGYVEILNGLVDKATPKKVGSYKAYTKMSIM